MSDDLTGLCLYMRACSLFTSQLFCITFISCSLTLKERIYLVSIHCISVLELSATINLYKYYFCFFRKVFPSHKFIGEETTAACDGVISDFTNDPTWIIDPIDGTMNFVHSHPMVSISVGLAVNKRLVIGIVFAPIIDKMYTAIKGKGAKLNGEPMKVTNLKG